MDTASEGYKTTQFGTDLNMAMSSKPIWEGPSAPIATPACDPTNLTFHCETAPILIWSKALVKNVAKVDQNGILFLTLAPIDTPTIFCSAMNQSIN